MRTPVSTGNGLFGELYLRSTKPFLPEHVTRADAEYLSARLAEHTVPGPVLDVGCGHGRHLHALKTSRFTVGLDLDALSLREVKTPAVRADFLKPPFRDGAFAVAYAWYNTLFTVEDERHAPLLHGLARCVRRGGLLILQGTNGAWARAQGTTLTHVPLADGSRLTEHVRFNAERGRDEIERRLELPDGRVMAASFFIRYYEVDALTRLLDDAGFTTMWVHGSLEGHPATERSPDLIVGAVKRG